MVPRRGCQNQGKIFHCKNKNKEDDKASKKANH